MVYGNVRAGEDVLSCEEADVKKLDNRRVFDIAFFIETSVLLGSWLAGCVFYWEWADPLSGSAGEGVSMLQSQQNSRTHQTILDFGLSKDLPDPISSAWSLQGWENTYSPKCSSFCKRMKGLFWSGV